MGTCQAALADRPSDTDIQAGAPSTGEEVKPDGMLLVRRSLLSAGLSEQNIEIILDS